MSNRKAAFTVYLIVVAIVLATWAFSAHAWFWVVFFVVLPLFGIGVLSLDVLGEWMLGDHEPNEHQSAQGHQGRRTSVQNQRNIGFGALLGYGLLYILATSFVVAVLYGGYVLDFGIHLADIKIPPIVYVAVIAFLAYKVQQQLSHAYGARRVIDVIVSIPMAFVVVVAVALWLDVPFVHRGVTYVASKFNGATGWNVSIASTPDDYKLVTALLFGFVSLWDVWLRDLFGFGRLSGVSHLSNGMGSAGVRGVRREDLVSGAHGNLPDRAEVLDHRVRNEDYVFPVDARLVLRSVVMRDPFTGKDVQVVLPARAAARLIDRLSAEDAVVLPPPAKKPADATPPATADAAGAGAPK